MCSVLVPVKKNKFLCIHAYYNSNYMYPCESLRMHVNGDEKKEK